MRSALLAADLAVAAAVAAAAAALASCSPAPRSGSFQVLTYNVAGLPEGISRSHPEVNSAKISPILNAYDIVLMQEDFTYQADLRSKADHAFKTLPKQNVIKLTGDGLSVFSRFDFDTANVAREPWRSCHGGLESGSDCLSEKGFLRTQIMLHPDAPDLTIDLIDLHLDAGRSPADHAARSAQADQLLAAITASVAPSAALIVAGDTNLKVGAEVDDAGILTRVLDGARLEDACRSLGCGDERIDRVLFRGRAGGDLDLFATEWRIDPTFLDEAGQDLSDHPAVAVTFEWRRAEP